MHETAAAPGVEMPAHLQVFYDRLEESFISQARRLINHDIYTKSILSTLPVALIAADRDGVIQTANRAAEQMIGVHTGASQALCLDDLFARYPELVAKLHQTLETGERAHLSSLALTSLRGEENVVNIYIKALLDDEGAICGTILALEDQTYVSFLKDAFKRHMPAIGKGPLIAESPVMKRVAAQIEALGEDTSPVLVSGPPGTGKTFVAGKLHERAGGDSGAPFIVVDCRTLGEDGAQETLFGTGATGGADAIAFRSRHDYGVIHLAEGGTLVLRHVEALAPPAQEGVLALIRDQQSDARPHPDVRVMATTSGKLSALAAAGQFNGELAQWLGKTVVEVPALRNRRKDILPLARYFLSEQSRAKTPVIGTEGENALYARHFETNNVNELKEAVNLAALVASGGEILPEHLFTGPKEEALPFEFDLTRLPLVRWLTTDRVLSVLRVSILSFFAAMIATMLAAPASVVGRGLNEMVWSVWWPALIVVFLLLGRVWCTVCALSTAASLARRKAPAPSPPEWLKKHSDFLIPLGFLVIVWVEHVFHMTEHPLATGILLLTLIGAAAAMAFSFERESWCRYLCPLGNLGALFSLPATLGVRPDPHICANRCTTHECLKGAATRGGCPVFHHPLYVREAHVCKLCLSCIKSCPNGSARLYLRPPMMRTWRQPDIADSVVLFSLVVCFVAPVMLASRIVPAVGSTAGFTVGVTLCMAAALWARRVLPRFLSRDDDARMLTTARVALALILLSWGPMAAFHLSSSRVLRSLVMKGSTGAAWEHLIPGAGIPVLAVLQTGAILAAALLALITLRAVYLRLVNDGVALARGVGASLWVVCGSYVLGTLALVLRGALP